MYSYVDHITRATNSLPSYVRRSLGNAEPPLPGNLQSSSMQLQWSLSSAVDLYSCTCNQVTSLLQPPYSVEIDLYNQATSL